MPWAGAKLAHKTAINNGDTIVLRKSFCIKTNVEQLRTPFPEYSSRHKAANGSTLDKCKS
jgi:hypothetical protein